MFAVFNWVLFSSLMACLIILIILLVKLVVKDKVPPSWHYFIWFLLVIRLVLPVAPGSPLSILNVLPTFRNIVLKTYDVQVSTEKNTVNETGAVIVPAKTLTNSQSGPSQTRHNDPVQGITMLSDNFNHKMSINLIALLTWLTGVIIFGIYVIFINGRLLLRIQTNAQEAQELEKEILEHCKSILNIEAKIPSMITPAVRTPVLLGFFRPILLLPYHLLDEINSDELKHIFLRELTHFKRKDFAVNGLMVFLEIIHWFNPLVWYGFYIMHQDSEIACDALVLSRMEHEERQNYGYTIIHLMRIAKPQRIPGVTGIMAKQSKMKKRIIRISSFKKSSAKSIAVGTALLILLGTIMLTGAENSSAAQVTTSNTHNSNLMSSDTYVGPGLSNDSPVKTVKTNTTASLIDIQGQNFVGKFSGKMMVVPDPSKIVVGFSVKNSKPDKTTSEMAQESKAVGAINAGASNSDSVFGPAISAAGFIASNGKLIFDDMKDDNSAQDVAALTDKGLLIVGRHTIAELKKSSVQEAVSAGPSLIVNGVPQNLSNDFGVSSRTAIGQKADGTGWVSTSYLTIQ
ncbi:MAG: M56 family metallopeptidase [Desulfitobacteriaceae bacterium]